MVRPEALGLGSLDIRAFWDFLKGHTPSLCEVRSPPLGTALSSPIFTPPWAVRLDASAAHSPTTSCPEWSRTSEEASVAGAEGSGQWEGPRPEG